MKTVSFTTDYIFFDDQNPNDQARFYSGKLLGDPNNAQWDLRITHADMDKLTHVLDIMPVGQL